MMMILRFLLLFCLLASGASGESTFLEETSLATSSEWEGWLSKGEKESGSFQDKFLHMLLVLGLMVAFMWLASFALKRLMRSRITTIGSGTGRIAIVESRYLSPRATLHLVSVDGKTHLIAESPTQVTHLAEVKE